MLKPDKKQTIHEMNHENLLFLLGTIQFEKKKTSSTLRSLEYASSVWNSHRRADVRIIEDIQGRETRPMNRIHP